MADGDSIDSISFNDQHIVIVCIDASEHSTKAFQWYIDNVYQTGDCIGLTHIHIPPDIPTVTFNGDSSNIDYFTNTLQASISKSKEIVESYKEICKAREIPFKKFIRTAQDSIGHTICDIASENNAKFIVIGQRGLGKIRRTLFVNRKQLNTIMSGRKALICVDASQHSQRALDWYFTTLHRDGDEVGLVHVHQLPDFPVEFGIHAGELLSSDLYQQSLEQSINASKTVVESFKKRCDERGVTPTVFLETMVHSVGNTICKVAKEHNTSVIVIGQRGLGAVRRTLFGSVSDYVLHHTQIPTVIVPPEES